MTKQPDPPDSQPDILSQLSPDDALAVLRILAEDATIAARVRKVAVAYVEDSAPHGPEDVETIAEDLYFDLEQLEVEEVWDRSGQTRDGYVEPQDAANEMAQEVIEPYLTGITRYQRLGMRQEAMYLCMGILQGLYQFEHQSTSTFREWATDLSLSYAEDAIEQWRGGGVKRKAVAELRAFIETSLPLWSATLLRSLSSSESHQ
jgi:hypothetical protein